MRLEPRTSEPLRDVTVTATVLRDAVDQKEVPARRAGRGPAMRTDVEPVAGLQSVNSPGATRSRPRMYGRTAFGMTSDPSACW